MKLYLHSKHRPVTRAVHMRVRAILNGTIPTRDPPKTLRSYKNKRQTKHNKYEKKSRTNKGAEGTLVSHALQQVGQLLAATGGWGYTDRHEGVKGGH